MRRAALHDAIFIVVLAGILATSAATMYACQAVRTMVFLSVRATWRGPRTVRAFVVKTAVTRRARQFGTAADAVKYTLAYETQGHGSIAKRVWRVWARGESNSNDDAAAAGGGDDDDVHTTRARRRSEEQQPQQLLITPSRLQPHCTVQYHAQSSFFFLTGGLTHDKKLLAPC